MDGWDNLLGPRVADAHQRVILRDLMRRASSVCQRDCVIASISARLFVSVLSLSRRHKGQRWSLVSARIYGARCVFSLGVGCVRVGGILRKQMRSNWSGVGGDSETTDDSAYAACPVISLYNCRTNGLFFEVNGCWNAVAVQKAFSWWGQCFWVTLSKQSTQSAALSIYKPN